MKGTKKDAAALSPHIQSSKMGRRFSHIVARAWSDDGFKKKLLTKPEEVFSEYSLTMPAGVKIKILEDTDAVVHFILPPKPKAVRHVKLDSLPINPYPAETFDCHDSSLSMSDPTKCDRAPDDDGTM